MQKLSRYVKKLDINNSVKVLNHSLLMEQVFFYDDKILGDDNFRKLLLEKNFLNKSDLEIKESIISSLKNREFTLLRILLTDLCNLNCKYCKVCNNIKNPIITTTPISSIKKALSVLFKEKNKPKVIHITGGEPLLFFNEIREIVLYIIKNYPRNKYKYIIVIGTNGILLDEKKLSFFKKYGIKVIISLDGKKEANILRVNQKGVPSFKPVLKALANLNRKKIEVGISMVVGQHNIDKIQDNINFIIKKINPSSIGVNFIKKTGIDKHSPYLINGKVFANAIYDIHIKNRSKGIFLELLARKLFPFVLQRYRPYDCGASNGTTINVDSSGNLGICKSFLCLETLCTKDDMGKIINNFKRRSPLYNKYCVDCSAQGICGNGCAYEAEIYDKDKVIDKRACRYVMEFYQRFINDLFEVNKAKALEEMQKQGYYIPTKSDRKKILGKVKKNFLSLKQCIGHEV